MTPSRFANAAIAYVAYIGKMFYPADLAVLYPLRLDQPVWEAVAALAVILAISAAVVAVRRKCPYLLVGWFWYLGMLVPVIGLVQVGVQAMADRYTYLPQIGITIAIAWGAAHAAGAWPSRHRSLTAVSILLIAGLMVCAWRQTRYSRDGETLWSHTLACTSQNWTAHFGLGQALKIRGQIDEAMPHFQMALEIRPDYSEAHNGVGYVLAFHRKYDEATAHFQGRVELKPDNFDALNNMGHVLDLRGQADDAMMCFQKALEIKPDFADAHINLGVLLAKRGDFEGAFTHFRQAPRKNINAEVLSNVYVDFGLQLAGKGRLGDAVAQYRRALEVKPDNDEALSNLGGLLAIGGQVDEAIVCIRKALEIKPDNVQALSDLGGLLAGRDRVDEAMSCFRKAVEIKPDYAKAHYNLGCALAGRGQIDEAIVHIRKALETMPNDADSHNVLGNLLGGQSDEAIMHLRKVVEMKPDLVSARLSLGAALAKRGKRDEAREQYQQALRLAASSYQLELANSIREQIKQLR